MESLAESSSVVDLSIDEDDLVTSQKNKVPKINCPERPGTPDTQCSICLEDLTNKCNSDSCWHTFCFECLKRWSEVQPSCPLCKNIFKNIHHSFTSHGLHETYNVPSREVVDRDTMVFRMNLFMDAFRRNDHGSLINVLQIQDFNDFYIPTHIINRIVGNHHNYGRTFQMISNFDNHGPIHDQVIGQITRTRVYNDDMWAQPLPDISGRFRDCSSAFFRDNPAQTHRLQSFILRDVLAIRTLRRSRGFLMSAHEFTITSLIMQTISIHEIRDAFMSNVLRPYLGIYTEHFCHELFNYANSPFDLIGYDSNVNYVSREELVTQMSTASFNIPVIFPTFPEDLRTQQVETIILDTDDEEIDTVTSQFRSEIIELSSDNSDIEIVNQPFHSVETLDLTSDEPSTSNGIRNSLNRPNNRYNLRRRRLLPSTSNGSSSYPANFSHIRCTSRLRRRTIMDSSSSDEEFRTSARGSHFPHLEEPAAYRRNKRTKKKNKYKKQKRNNDDSLDIRITSRSRSYSESSSSSGQTDIRPNTNGISNRARIAH